MANVFRGPLYSLKGLVRPFVGFVALNLLLTTLGVEPGPAPFKQTEWPISPPRVELRVEPPPNLLGTTLAPVVAAPFAPVDFTLPVSYQRLVVLQPPNLLTSTLFTGVPFAQSDWLVPRGPVRQNLTWTQALLPAGLTARIEPFTQTDWLVPVSLPVKSLAWVPSNLALEEPKVDPFSQTDWPLPRERVRENVTWVWTSLPEILARTEPFSQADWVVPRQRLRQDLTWTWTYPPGLLAKTDPFIQTDWTILSRPPWIRHEGPPNLQATTLAPSEAAPFFQLDWTLPRGIARPNLTWTQNLLQSTLFVEQLPFRQLDWPIVVLRYNRNLTWVQNLGVLTSARIDPFVQSDWPNPARVAYSILIPNWTCPRNLPLQAAVCSTGGFIMILND